MQPSRRNLFQAVGAGAALMAAGTPEAIAADAPATPPVAPATSPAMPPDFGKASSANNPVNIVSPEHLEAEARKMISPGRFAITGWCGEGLTYRANRAALDETPILPRRLQHVSEEAIDLRTSILGHALPFPMITCPMGAWQLPCRCRGRDGGRHRRHRHALCFLGRLDQADGGHRQGDAGS